MKFILKKHDEIRHLFEKGGKLAKLWPLFDAQDTFMFTPAETTHSGAHVRDAIDLKRVMITVVLALIPCLLFGIYNAGYHYADHAGDTSLMTIMIRGSWMVIPIVLVSYIAGGVWEVLFSCVRRHEINEGFLVTGMLFPLTLPPTIPLWQVALGISFGVVIGKEVFGGTGMNILNPALTARAFLFFSYPKWIIGDNVWGNASGGPAILSSVEGITQATPLAVASQTPVGESAIAAMAAAGHNLCTMIAGLEVGSIGETSVIACILGAGILLATRIGSWQIMAATVLGLLGGGVIANIFGASAMSQLPPYYHLLMGGFAFGCVFMVTDPVSAAATPTGKWIYGILVGLVIMIVRLVNGAYVEGVMLAILFGNVCAPLIDHYVVEAHIKRRQARV